MNATALKVMRGRSSLGTDELIDWIVEKNSDTAIVQAFDYHKVINKLHLQAAYTNTIEAFSEGTNISDKPYMEFLLFAAMTRQISVATSIFRIKDIGNFVIASDSAAVLAEAKRFINLSEYKTNIEDELKTAKSIGIESDYKSLNQRLLQKMAISRLQD